MVDVRAFRGIRYTDKELSRKLAPPYDVIDDATRAELAEKDAHNCVELVLPKGESPYKNAASLLEQWLAQQVLRRDDKPAIYRYHQVFTPPGGTEETTRKGFVAEVRLHRFDERKILRHELTLKGPKIDRLNLMKATAAHTSQIFTMYSDPQRQVDALFAPFETGEPTAAGVTDDGTTHKLWVITDETLHAALSEKIRDQSLYIADGHHRYETMIAYRDWLWENGAGQAVDDPSQFGMMFLVNMDDPGLVVLPTHRLVHSVAGFDYEKLIERLGEWFEVMPRPWPTSQADIDGWLDVSRPAFVVAAPNQSEVSVCVLKADVDASAALGISTAEAALDVAVLHGFAMEQTLGISKEAQALKTNIEYIKQTDEAVTKAKSGAGQVVFLMRATPSAHVKAVADADGVMPQKSTFYYPKIATGMVFRKPESS